jgi:tetratricopeptide (TPR) repeat protein
LRAIFGSTSADSRPSPVRQRGDFSSEYGCGRGSRHNGPGHDAGHDTNPGWVTFRAGPYVDEARSGEPASSRNNRERTAKSHLVDAKKALEDRHYADASAAALRAMELSGRTDFGTSPNETNSIVAKAKAAQAAEENQTRTANAQKLVVQAKALASSNNMLEALNKLREARMLSPQAVNEELESSLVDQARKLGEAALARARFLDVNSNRREEALKEFERAAQFLDVVPGGHPGLAYAKAARHRTEIRTLAEAPAFILVCGPSTEHASSSATR